MGEPLRAYGAGQELLCRPPSNSNASGTPVRASCPRLRLFVLAGFAYTWPYCLAPCVGGWAAFALPPAYLGCACVGTCNDNMSES